MRSTIGLLLAVISFGAETATFSRAVSSRQVGTSPEDAGGGKPPRIGGVPVPPPPQWQPPTEATAKPRIENSLAGDFKLLGEAGVGTEGSSLVEFFRKQLPTDEERRAIAHLVVRLGHDDFEVREEASRKLIGLGYAAVPALREGLGHRDPEVVQRAKACLERLPKFPPGEIRAAAARVLALRKPAGAAEALLGFLPEGVKLDEEDVLVRALAAMATRDGKTDFALVSALTDKLPVRRAIA